MSNNIEEWRDIKGTNGLYQISDHGRVKSFKQKKPRIMKPSGIRYKQIVMNVDKKLIHKRINRLVLEAFVGPCPEGYEAAHLNCIRTDNRIENLKWCSRVENRSHERKYNNGKLFLGKKLGYDNAVKIRRLRADGYKYHQLAEMFGVNTNTIIDAVKGNTYKAPK